MDIYNLRSHSLEKTISRFQSRIEFLTQKSNKFSVYRLSIFITGLVLTISAFIINKELGWVAAAISILSFGIAVHFHNKLLMGIKRCHSYLKIKEQHFARMNIEWENIPPPLVNIPSDEQSLGKDLDLYGNRSLQHLIDVAVSYEGSSLLRKWISNYAPDKDTILQRQNIIRELTTHTRFRDKFLLKAHLISKKPLNCSAILNWLGKSTIEKIPEWLLPVASVLIIIYLTLFILNLAGIIGSGWFAVFLIYFFLYSSFQKKISKIVEESAVLENQFRKFSILITYIEKFSFSDSPAMKKFTEQLRANNASDKLKRLQKIIAALLIRENPIVRLIVNIFFPYDIFYCRKLQTLKSEIEKDIPRWLEKLNELECYVSLSNFAWLNPDYVFPEIEINRKNIFETRAMGHPLIKRINKISNDFFLKKKNEILIITGSNMSGKSTFLKTIGINLCLAYAGAPVNSDILKTSLYELFTCIKVNDSVADGISYFYAEVKRLKELLDEFKNEKHLEVFFLIDEIFKGTNNRERVTGSRAYIKKLSQLNGTGAVTTHDLELVNIAGEIPAITNYHFREDIDDGKMVFDYKIHDGPCPTTNALKIMKLAGLPVD